MSGEVIIFWSHLPALHVSVYAGAAMWGVFFSLIDGIVKEADRKWREEMARTVASVYVHIFLQKLILFCWMRPCTDTHPVSLITCLPLLSSLLHPPFISHSLSLSLSLCISPSLSLTLSPPPYLRLHCWNNHQLPTSHCIIPLSIFPAHPGRVLRPGWLRATQTPVSHPAPGSWAETDSSMSKSIIIFRRCNPIPEDIPQLTRIFPLVFNISCSPICLFTVTVQKWAGGDVQRQSMLSATQRNLLSA